MSKNPAAVAVAETAVEEAVEATKGSSAKTRVLVAGGVVLSAAVVAGVIVYKRRKDAAAADDLTAVMDATNE